ncbi:MAG: hypothetical protein GPJ11_04655 [Microcystis aeruginosa L211-101]|nr:hypothetical protein [Microcystis aeruginosa L211-11]NCR30242.1 hypothetical protein [Microcystis aeruginosa L211-101]
MIKREFESMSREELRSYILEHREDESAFQIYLDRVTAEPGEIYPAPRSIEDLSHFPELVAKNRRDKQQKI